MLCGDLEGWDWGAGREDQEGAVYVCIYIYIYTHIRLIHFVVQQKPTQPCKATMPPFRKIPGR